MIKEFTQSLLLSFVIVIGIALLVGLTLEQTLIAMMLILLATLIVYNINEKRMIKQIMGIKNIAEQIKGNEDKDYE